MTRPAVVVSVVALAVLSVTPSSGLAQVGRLDPRLGQRLDARTLSAVSAIVDSARTAALPTEPLVNKALEGLAKKANGERIAVAVRGLAQRLGAARGALGSTARESELVSGAGALQAGVAASTLARLRSVRPAESVALPLVVLTDLIARGVPADTASSTIVALAGSGADDATFAELRRDVEQDITEGARPASAVTLRARGVLVSVPVRRVPARPGQTTNAIGVEASDKPRPPKP